MAEYEEKLLVSLAEKYRKSKKDSGTNKIARRTSIRPGALYKGYNRNDGDMAQIEAVNRAVRRCQEKGFVTFDTEGFSNEIRRIYLVDEKIEEVERYLEKTFHYESTVSKRKYVEGLIAAYSGLSPGARCECERLRQALEQNRIPSRYTQTEELLKALVFIENNREELYLREASMLIYGDSKYLEETMLHPVCKTLRELLKCPCGTDELEDEILEHYHITREKQKLCIKGGVTLRIGERDVKLGGLADGVEFFSGDLERLERVTVHAPAFMTVENYTSWLRLKSTGAALLYLGGYATRFQRDFLKKVFEDNPNLTFWHFGDIDAGGLYIHEHLCRVTGIPFRMYRMSCAELMDARFQRCLRPLTQQDKTRLKSLEEQEAYRELAAYMLAHNVKLEQEIISYYEGVGEGWSATNTCS